MAEYTKEDYCLSDACRFYGGEANAQCFRKGVLSKCSPEFKKRRKLLDAAAPDMYEALWSALDLICLKKKSDFSVNREAIEKVIRRAIAKAEGKE